MTMTILDDIANQIVNQATNQRCYKPREHATLGVEHTQRKPKHLQKITPLSKIEVFNNWLDRLGIVALICSWYYTFARMDVSFASWSCVLGCVLAVSPLRKSLDALSRDA